MTERATVPLEASPDQTGEGHKPGRSTKRLLLSNSAWTVAGYGGRQAFRVASNLVLTRLLTPQAFGLMLIVNTIVRGIRMLSDVGLGPCILRDDRGEEVPFLNTAWTIQMVRGFILWGIVCLLALPLSWVYEEPELATLLPVVGLSSGILGFMSITRHVAHRRQQIPRMVIFELLAQIITVGGTVALAFVLRSVWALALGTLVAAGIKAVLSHFMFPKHPHRFLWEREASRALLHFGRWVLVSTACTFLARNGNRLILGKLVSFEILGVFSIALTFVQAAQEVVAQLESKVILPAVTRSHRMPRDDFRQQLSVARRKALVYCAPIVAAMACFSEPLVEFLFPEKFHEAGWMAAILSLSLWVSVCTAAYRPVIIALGQPKLLAAANAVQGLALLIAVPIAYNAYGLLGAIIAMACIELPAYVVLNWVLAKERLSGVRQDGVLTLVFAVWLAVLYPVRNLIM